MRGRAPPRGRSCAPRARRARRTGRPRAPGREGTATRQRAPLRRRRGPRWRARWSHPDEGAFGAVARGEAPLLARVGPERDQGAEQEDSTGEPDQVDERLHEHLEVHGAALRVDLVRDHVDVLERQQAVPDRDLVRARALGGVVVLAGGDRAEIVTAAGEPEVRPQLARVRALPLRRALERERVARYLHRLPRLEALLADRLVGAAAGAADRV